VFLAHTSLLQHKGGENGEKVQSSNNKAQKKALLLRASERTEKREREDELSEFSLRRGTY
jgi:hypothetical protein